VGWAIIRDAVLTAGLGMIAVGSAFLSALVTYPNPAHRQLLATIEQVLPRLSWRRRLASDTLRRGKPASSEPCIGERKRQQRGHDRG
jgi:hypothetical protein